MDLHQQKAFSLVELLIAVLLLALLTNIALPALAKLQQKQRNQAAYEALSHLIHHARTQALTQKRSMLLCPSPDGIRCSSDWSQPWLLRAAAGGQVLNYAAPFMGNTRPKWQGFSDSIRFHSNGTSPTSNGRFYFCLDEEVTHQLILNRQGRLRRGTAEENRLEQARCR